MKKLKFPKLVVAGLIEKEGKYLLIKELLESKHEFWIIPGGKVDFGESLEEAVSREIKEEVGLTAKKLEFLDFHEAIFPNFGYHTIIFFFKVTVIDFNLTLEKQILEADFFTPNQIKKLNLASSAKWLFDNLGSVYF